MFALMMGKIQLQNFEIRLSDNKRTYLAGECVNGKCVIALEGELQLTMIQMHLIGLAEVKWTEHRGSGNHRRTRTYYDKVQYLNMDYDFVRNTDNAIITKGIHEFPFTYELPNDIPSSFTGFHGKIQYWIEAEIKKPLFSVNHRTKTDFEVESPLIFNDLMMPLSETNEKKTGFLWAKSGNISVEVKMTQRGFSPGDVMAVNCCVTNRTAAKVSPRATLKQTQACKAKGKHKISETKYIRVEGSPVDHGLTNVETLLVPIPANIALSIDSSIITVFYEVHVTVVIPAGLNLHIDVPIVITKESVLNKSSVYSGEDRHTDHTDGLLFVQL